MTGTAENRTYAQNTVPSLKGTSIETGKIEISRLADGSFCIFKLHDAQRARRDHHVLGTLIGSLPQAPQQNTFMGLPLRLSTEEAAFLVASGAATVRDNSSSLNASFDQVSKSDVDRFWEKRATDAACQRRQNEIENFERRRRFLEQNGLIDKVQSSVEMPDKMQFNIDKPVVGQSDSCARTSVILPDGTDLLAGRNAENPQHNEMSTAASFAVSNSYTGPLYVNRTRLAVFSELVRRGYYLNSGLKFGCDFLAYPGDPLRFHSHLQVKIVGWKEPIKLQELISGGRLGTTVKKCWLIASAVDPNDPVNFQEDIHTRNLNVNGKPVTEPCSNNLRARFACVEWAAFG